MAVRSPKEYRELAHRVRELAINATSVDIQTALLEVAATYDDLALQSERLSRMGYQTNGLSDEFRMRQCRIAIAFAIAPISV